MLNLPLSGPFYFLLILLVKEISWRGNRVGGSSDWPQIDKGSSMPVVKHAPPRVAGLSPSFSFLQLQPSLQWTFVNAFADVVWPCCIALSTFLHSVSFLSSFFNLFWLVASRDVLTPHSSFNACLRMECPQSVLDVQTILLPAY